MSATDGMISALERKKVSDILSEAAKRVSGSKFGSPIRPGQDIPNSERILPHARESVPSFYHATTPAPLSQQG